MSEFDQYGRMINTRLRDRLKSELEQQLEGKRLTTAEVIFYMPDHPVLLQRFLWQTLDIAPEYPRITSFLDFWRREIDAVIHSVNVGGVGLIAPAKLSTAREIGTLTCH